MGRDPCQVNFLKQLYWEESGLLSSAPASFPCTADFSSHFSVIGSHVITSMSLSWALPAQPQRPDLQLLQNNIIWMTPSSHQIQIIQKKARRKEHGTRWMGRKHIGNHLQIICCVSSSSREGTGNQAAAFRPQLPPS